MDGKSFNPIVVIAALILVAVVLFLSYEYVADVERYVSGQSRDEYGGQGSQNVRAWNGLQVYSSPDGAYEFSFPANWVVEREFDTRNDAGVPVRGVVIRRDICDNGNNWVYVNPEVAGCDIGECVVIGNNTLVTYTDDPEFYVVFEDVVKSFIVK